MYRLKRENVVKLTDSEEKKERLLAQGFALLAEEQNEKPPEKAMEEMTLPELKKLAKDKGIDIGGVKQKNEILAMMQEIGSDADDGTGEDGAAE